MKSNKTLNIQTSNSSKEISDKNQKLQDIKNNTREYLEAHNKVVTLLWEVKHDIAVNKDLLKKSNEEKNFDSITSKIEFLEKKQKILNQCLDENHSLEIIKQKFAEIEILEKEINPDKNINFKSPYSL